MDPITLFGIFGGIGAVLLSALMEGTELGHLIHPAAMLLIVGGTLGATSACYSMSEMLLIVKSTREAFRKTSVHGPDLVRQIGELATLARREGVLAMEFRPIEFDMPILKRAIRLVVDGTDPELLKDLLLVEVNGAETRLKTQGSIYQTAGGFAPTMGIIGTVVGLVHVLGNLAEPDRLGGAIAGAFLATLYGISSANLIFLPLAKKLQFRATQEADLGMLVVEGMVSIQKGDNPRIIQDKLVSMLPVEERVLVQIAAEGAPDATKGKKAPAAANA